MSQKLHHHYYMVPLGTAIALLVFAFVSDTPLALLEGIIEIINQPGTLVSDYMEIVGVGPALANAGLLGLVMTAMSMYIDRKEPTATITALFLVMGFGLFGKNLMNIWFILLGVYCYTKWSKTPFSSHWAIGLFGTAMAPMTSDLMFSDLLPAPLAIFSGIAIGLLIGFILPPVAAWIKRIHEGFNLYNAGLAAGLIGTVLVSIFKSYGYLPEPRFFWHSGDQFSLMVMLVTLFGLMIIAGRSLQEDAVPAFLRLLKDTGQAPADFIKTYGEGATLINMGLNGFLSTGYIVLIGGQLNGPTIGGIMTVVGFGAMGKHVRNIFPIFLGVYLGSISKIWHATDPALQLAALFGTALAPFTGVYGWLGGLAAAFVHMSVVLNVGGLHGGLNLYNNGFSAGIVAMILLPVFRLFKDHKPIDS